MPFIDPSTVAGPLAYIDAGSAAIVVQALLAGVAGLILFIKLQGRRFLSMFGAGPKDSESEGPEGE